METQEKFSQERMILLFFVSTLMSVAAQPSSSCKYAQYAPGKTHYGCLAPNTSCTIYKSGVSAADKTLIVKMHNDIRSREATGKQPGYKGVLLPSAQNMRQLIWNDELALLAQKRTDQCLLVLVTPPCFECHSVAEYDTGEAIYYEYKSSQPQRNDWSAPISFWAQDSKNLKSIAANNFTATSFTQMIWSSTKDIGCAFTRFGGNPPWRYMEFYTCLYGPAGNYQNEAIYEAGPVCGDCDYDGSTTCCDSTCQQSNTPVDYSGLCKLTSSSKK